MVPELLNRDQEVTMGLRLEKKSDCISVSGLVTPCEWDSKGNPLELKICGAGEVDYVLISDKNSKRLKKFIRKWVIVTGELSTLDNTNFLKVKKFKPFQEPGDSYE